MKSKDKSSSCTPSCPIKLPAGLHQPLLCSEVPTVIVYPSPLVTTLAVGLTSPSFGIAMVKSTKSIGVSVGAPLRGVSVTIPALITVPSRGVATSAVASPGVLFNPSVSPLADASNITEASPVSEAYTVTTWLPTIESTIAIATNMQHNLFVNFL